MNIPEGWPTEEMVDAVMKIEPNHHSRVAYWRDILITALDAAPTSPVPILQLETKLSDRDVQALQEYLVQIRAETSPVQENENRLCPECGAECMRVSIPNNSWHKCNKCSWESPSAQEDKPVAEIKLINGLPKVVAIVGYGDLIPWQKAKELGNGKPSDGIRKALSYIRAEPPSA